MTRRIPVALVACLALAAGCGGDDDNGSADEPKSGNAAQYQAAEAAMKKNEYDSAFKILRELGNEPGARERIQKFQVVAAEETLANARRKLRQAPRAAMSLTRTSLRYHPTPEARAFLVEATNAHDIFKRKQQAKGNL